MNPQQKEKLKQKFSSYGGAMWELLVDTYDDKDFFSSLTSQEKNLLNQLLNTLGSIHGYEDVLSGVLFKYIAWINYKNSGIQKIKKDVDDLSSKIDQNKENLQTIENSAKFIGGATILVEYSKSFSNSSIHHKRRSKWQASFYALSLVLFFLISVLVFTVSVADVPYIKGFIAEDINELPYNIGFFSLKAALLIFTFQITQFFRKNYNAEKHLEEVYRHRSDVLQSLHAVYNSITNPEERDQILKAGALFAYERGETGYITTKEGAGAGEDMVGAILSRMTRQP